MEGSYEYTEQAVVQTEKGGPPAWALDEGS